MQKKGEMTSSTIGNLILLIAAFLILAAFLVYYVLDFGGQDAREICHISVLTRGTINEGYSAFEQFAPLKCTTEKICISESGDCDPQFTGEKNIQKIKLRGTPEQQAEIIEQTTANAMLDCWNMMGEGKLDLFGGQAGTAATITGLGDLYQKQSTCVICSRIAIDNNIDMTQINPHLNINEYLRDTPVPTASGQGTETYLNRFTDRQVRAYPETLQENLNAPVQPTREIAVIFMQILTEKDELSAGLSTGAYAGGLVFAGTSWVGPFGQLLTLKTSGVLAGVAAIGTGSIAAFQTYNSRTLSAGYCTKHVQKNGDPRDGCSILTTINYNDIEQINSLCGRIEGNP